MMRLAVPAFLLLLPVLLWFWRSGPRPSPRHQRVLRTLASSLLILAVAGLEVITGEAPLSIMFVVDASDSMAAARADAERTLAGLMTGLRDDDRAGIIVFGASPVMERSPSAPSPLSGRTGEITGTGTDIESALRLARVSLPAREARRIVLLSDGLQTEGDALREATRAAADGVPIDTIALGDSAGSGAVMRHLSAPDRAAPGQPFVLTALAEGAPDTLADVVFETSTGEVGRQQVRVSSSGYATATHVAREREPGVFVYKAGILDSVGSGTSGEVLSTSGAVVAVSGEPRVLHVTPRTGPAAAVVSALNVRSIAAAEFPTSPTALLSYSAVILDDVAQEMLNAAQLDALTQHVEHRGAGLLVLGSARSLDGAIVPDAGLGGLLPIDLRPRSGVRTSGAALAIVLDKSGSMDEHTSGAAKIEFARQGVRSALEGLSPTDALGVIAFDSTPTVVAPLQSGHDERVIVQRLGEVRPAGSTAIAPAVQMARDWLAAADAAQFPRRHVLLVSDGRSSEADASRLEALVRGGGFRFSVIALGQDSDRRLLRTLAESSGGRAYFPEDVRDLPMLTAREAARVAGGRTVEEPFAPRLLSHPISTGLDVDRTTTLGGYVVSAPKPGAEIAIGSHRDDPVLATWRYGLGKVAVYTADLHAAWSARLRGSRTYAPLVTRAIQWLSQTTEDGPFYVRFRENGDRLRIIVDAADGAGHITGLRATASVRPPSGDVAQLVLAESLPGRYEGDVATAGAGPYIVSLEARLEDGTFDARTLRGFYWNADREHRTRGADRPLLSALSATTGGQVLGASGDPFSQRPAAYRPLRSWLLAAAFFTFLAELLAPWRRSLVHWSGPREAPPRTGEQPRPDGSVSGGAVPLGADDSLARSAAP